MTERSEGSPLSREVMGHLRRVAGPVSLNDPRHGAVHGTSLEVIKYLLTTGRLPGIQVTDDPYIPGDISVFPTRQLDVSKIPDIASRSDVLENTIAYARGIGRSHRFLTSLGLPLKHEDIRMARNFLTLPDEDEDGVLIPEKYFLQKGFSQQQVDTAFREADKTKACGFLLGISPAIQGAKELDLVKGDPGEGDIAIRTFGKGLSFERISGFEPLGDAERKYVATF